MTGHAWACGDPQPLAALYLVTHNPHPQVTGLGATGHVQGEGKLQGRLVRYRGQITNKSLRLAGPACAGAVRAGAHAGDKCISTKQRAEPWWGRGGGVGPEWAGNGEPANSCVLCRSVYCVGARLDGSGPHPRTAILLKLCQTQSNLYRELGFSQSRRSREPERDMHDHTRRLSSWLARACLPCRTDAATQNIWNPPLHEHPLGGADGACILLLEVLRCRPCSGTGKGKPPLWLALGPGGTVHMISDTNTSLEGRGGEPGDAGRSRSRRFDVLLTFETRE
jgi:hypothetical protein